MFRNRTGRACAVAAACLLASSVRAQAQQGPAAPTDAPSIKVGVLLFADYTVVAQPRIVDGDGNSVALTAFQIGRAYVNLTGNISRTIAFRVTPDIVRDVGSGSALNGSYVYRLKYAYAQWNLDGRLTPGSFARLGQQQSPWIDMVDTVYRYRFQGPVFEDREGYVSPADAGASVRYVLPGNYGDVHAGVFNGENYQHPEVNDRKGFQIRASVRPLPGHGDLRGLRLTMFATRDAYVKNGERHRTIAAVTFEHPHVHAGFDYLDAADRVSASRPVVRSGGWTAFVTPISGHGWEGLLRFDRLVVDRINPDRTKARSIAGIAYWFPHQGGVAAAVMCDVDTATYENFAPARARERRFAIHSTVSF